MDAQQTRDWAASLTSHPWEQAKNLEGCGVYLIYDATGELLYVGESTDIGTRLCYHGGKENSGNLYWHLADDLADGEPAHHCLCGKFVSCPQGDRVKPSSPSRVISKRFSRFTVSFAEFEREDVIRFQYEHNCQHHLKPQYPKRRVVLETPLELK